MKHSLVRTDKELTELYKRHVDTVYRVCRVMLKNEHEAEDAVSNTFLRLMQDATVFESTEHEKAWLIKTASNLCRDHFRRRFTKELRLEDVPEAAEEPAEPDETLGKVMALPRLYRTVIYLFYYEGYSTAEIARILRKNESTVRGRLHTARKRLKLELEGDYQ